MKSRNVLNPQDMRQIINESAVKNAAVNASEVLWRDWKSFLESKLKVPSNFRITQYHQLRFRSKLLNGVSRVLWKHRNVQLLLLLMISSLRKAMLSFRESGGSITRAF